MGALFPAYFAALALSFGVTSLVNSHLVMRYGMRRLSNLAAIGVTFVSLASWGGVFAFDGLPPLWLFIVSLMLVFGGVGLIFGNLNALAMQPLGHIAGVGAALVALISTLVSVPLGGVIGYTLRRHPVRAVGLFRTVRCGHLRRYAVGGRVDRSGGKGLNRPTATTTRCTTPGKRGRIP